MIHVHSHKYHDHIYSSYMPTKYTATANNLEPTTNNQSIGMLTAKKIQPNHTWPATAHVQYSNDTFDNHLQAKIIPKIENELRPARGISISADMYLRSQPSPLTLTNYTSSTPTRMPQLNQRPVIPQKLRERLVNLSHFLRTTTSSTSSAHFITPIGSQASMGNIGSIITSSPESYNHHDDIPDTVIPPTRSWSSYDMYISTFTGNDKR